MSLMSVAEQYLKMAEVLCDKARKENNEHSRFELESAAEIYALLAQRAQVGDWSGALVTTDKNMPHKLDALIECDAKGLQQQILQHFSTRPTT
jgi:hypothetical protein